MEITVSGQQLTGTEPSLHGLHGCMPNSNLAARSWGEGGKTPPELHRIMTGRRAGGGEILGDKLLSLKAMCLDRQYRGLSRVLQMGHLNQRSSNAL